MLQGQPGYRDLIEEGSNFTTEYTEVTERDRIIYTEFSRFPYPASRYSSGFVRPWRRIFHPLVNARTRKGGSSTYFSART